MNIIERLLSEAQAMKPQGNHQWAFCDVNGKRLSVEIENFHGGDGQVRKANKRVVWHFDGKQVPVAKLPEALGD